MSGSFKLDDYVDVAERIREFSAKYPDGSLQSEIVIRDNGVLCKAFAYRSAQDEKPGIGHAFEPIPGKTPYTKDSEVMNAETSAWGRAIVALGFDTKKIASKQEVVARQDSPFVPPADVPQPKPPAPAPASESDPDAYQGDDPGLVRVHFGKNAGIALRDLAPKQRQFYAESWNPDTSKFPLKPQDGELRRAARILCGLQPLEIEGPFAATASAPAAFDDSDVPF